MNLCWKLLFGVLPFVSLCHTPYCYWLLQFLGRRGRVTLKGVGSWSALGRSVVMAIFLAQPPLKTKKFRVKISGPVRVFLAVLLLLRPVSDVLMATCFLCVAAC